MLLGSLYRTLFLVALFSFNSLKADNDLPFSNSKLVKVDGIELHYQIWEPELIKGKIVLVHGFAASTYSWRYTAEFLKSNNYLVIAVDIPPFGYSEKNTYYDYSDEHMQAVLWEMLVGIDLEKNTSELKWDAVGHSMGAGVTTRLAISQADNIRSTVIVDGLVSFRLTKFEDLLLGLKPIQLSASLLTKTIVFNKKHIRKVLTVAYGCDPTDEDVNEYLKPLKIKRYVPAVISKFTISNPNRKVNVSDYTTPVLIVWGDEDKWLPKRFGKDLNGKFQNSTLKVVKEAAHCPMETHPEEFNKILLKFLLDPVSSVSENVALDN